MYFWKAYSAKGSPLCSNLSKRVTSSDHVYLSNIRFRTDKSPKKGFSTDLHLIIIYHENLTA